MPVDKLFKPEKIAVVGASRHKGKTGHEVYDNLLHDFEGKTIPVNPNAEEVEGNKAYDEIPKHTDLAVIAVPSQVVPEVMKDAANKDVEAVIIISAGFSETGNKQLEQEVIEIARQNDIQLLGPNVLGLINTENNMNASFAAKTPEKGSISFMSQSGAFCTAILDYAKAEHIGFRHFVSLGNKAQMNEADFLKYWKNDEQTDVILSYTEGIEDGREFMKQARETSKQKPIIMVKSGRTSKGSKAASSHTGSVAGSYKAYQAAFRKTGIIEAESNRELLNYGRGFSYQSLPEGEKVAVITNAGGPGVITTDEINEKGLQLADFSEKTKGKLKEEMPEESTPHNPLDVIGDAGHERYRKAIDIIRKDSDVDSILVLLTPQANTEITKTAKTIVKQESKTDKTLMTAFIGEKDVQKGKKILEKNEIPDYEDPVDAIKTLKAMNEYREFKEQNKNKIEKESEKRSKDGQIETYEGFENLYTLLDSYGFDQLLSEVAKAPNPAIEAANRVGYPIVMKIDSPDIQHKTEIGAVQKGVESRQEVRTHFNEIIDNIYKHKPEAEINGMIIQEQVEPDLEVALGMKRDPQFGPMIMVGLGGIYIEALEDLSFGIAPIDENEAEKMIQELQSHEIFEGTRNQHDITEPVKEAIQRISQLSLDHQDIQSIDINPLIIKNETAYVADIEINTERNKE